MNLNNNFDSQTINSVIHKNLLILPKDLSVKGVCCYLDAKCLRVISHLCKSFLSLSNAAKIDFLNRGNSLLTLLKIEHIPTFAARLNNATQVRWLSFSKSEKTRLNPLVHSNILEMVGLFPKLTTFTINNIIERSPVHHASCLTDKVTELRVLDLSSNHIYNAGIVVLASKAHLLAKLRILKLFNNGISDYASKELAQLACLPALESLDLGQNHLTQEGILKILNNCTQPLKLHTLNLQSNTLSTGKAQFLTEENAYKLFSLCSLDLSKSIADFTPQIFARLIRLPNLKTFIFNENSISDLATSLNYLNKEPLKVEELALGEVRFNSKKLEVLVSRKELFINVRNLDLSQSPFVKPDLEDTGGRLAELINGLPNLKVINISNFLRTIEALREFLEQLNKLPLDKVIIAYKKSFFDGNALASLLDYVPKTRQINEIQLGVIEIEKFNAVLKALEDEEHALIKRDDLTPKSEEWRMFLDKKALLIAIRKGFENSCPAENLSCVKKL